MKGTTYIKMILFNLNAGILTEKQAKNFIRNFFLETIIKNKCKKSVRGLKLKNQTVENKYLIKNAN